MNSKRVFRNAKWIIVCKIAQSLLQLIVGMLCARYLGPANYGLVQYAASITAFALPVMKLGFDATLVYQMVNDPDKEGEILGTALGTNLLCSFLCVAGVTAYAAAANWNDFQTIVVCGLYSLSVIFAAVEMIQYWFQYKLLSKYASTIMLIAYVCVSCYRIYLLAAGKSVYWFALTHSVEYGLIGGMLMILYFRKSKHRLSFSLHRLSIMLQKGRYYILSSIMVVAIQNIDRIMITQLLGEAENGFYTAAITCSSMAQFVFIAITDSLRPVVLAQKKGNQTVYENTLAMLYNIVFYLSLLQALVLLVLAKPIVYILYGKDFLPTVQAMRILPWYFGFSMFGVVRNIWILAEDLQKYLLWINLTGVLFSMAANVILIPNWGICGAATAMVLTQFFINFLLGFLIVPIRANNRILIRGLSPEMLSQNIIWLWSNIARK